MIKRRVSRPINSICLLTKAKLVVVAKAKRATAISKDLQKKKIPTMYKNAKFLKILD